MEGGSLSELEQPLQAAKRKRDSAQPQALPVNVVKVIVWVSNCR